MGPFLKVSPLRNYFLLTPLLAYKERRQVAQITKKIDFCASCTGSRYDWLTCGTPTRLWAPSAVGVINQNGVDVQEISNLAIGFRLFWN